jgi:sRNA-binding carbon storage regulator CsrA
MLVIDRKQGDVVHIGNSTITILQGKAKLGIEAPARVRVIRTDAKKTQKSNRR